MQDLASIDIVIDNKIQVCVLVFFSAHKYSMKSLFKSQWMPSFPISIIYVMSSLKDKPLYNDIFSSIRPIIIFLRLDMSYSSSKIILSKMYHTNLNVSNGVHIPLVIQITNDGEMGLQHSKILFNIFMVCFFFLCKVLQFFITQLVNTLNKVAP